MFHILILLRFRVAVIFFLLSSGPWFFESSSSVRARTNELRTVSWWIQPAESSLHLLDAAPSQSEEACVTFLENTSTRQHVMYWINAGFNLCWMSCAPSRTIMIHNQVHKSVSRGLKSYLVCTLLFLPLPEIFSAERDVGHNVCSAAEWWCVSGKHTSVETSGTCRKPVDLFQVGVTIHKNS